MSKYSFLHAYLEKQLLVSVATIKISYYDLELLHDNLFFDLIVADDFFSCASMWIKIHTFLGSFVENGYVEKVSWFSCSLCGVLHAKLKGEFVENCDYVSSFLYASMKIFYGFIPSIKLLRFGELVEFDPEIEKMLRKGRRFISFNITNKMALVVVDKAKEEASRDPRPPMTERILARMQNRDAPMRNLETQIDQMAKLVSERPQGTLPSNMEVNPREHVNAVLVIYNEENPEKDNDGDSRNKLHEKRDEGT
ncbi:hypothetical protein M9H77_26849 [Catharanthus roseus]|uniref:Uncharacterized protein n=1 Tax=Catharanthus roseus TaxID=4058 RepID=A0ACC0ABU6_CATRO|nr:hypothetical protein M9H77_26849 [Catharanthus roseus]